MRYIKGKKLRCILRLNHKLMNVFDLNVKEKLASPVPRRPGYNLIVKTIVRNTLNRLKCEKMALLKRNFQDTTPLLLPNNLTINNDVGFCNNDVGSCNNDVGCDGYLVHPFGFLKIHRRSCARSSNSKVWQAHPRDVSIEHLSPITTYNPIPWNTIQSESSIRIV